jgi:integrase
LRPRIARRLKGEGITTLGELVAFCNRRGGSWWRSIPRIGPGRARAIVSWLRRQQAALQLTIEADVDSAEQLGVPLVAAELIEVAPAHSLDREKKQTASRLTLAPLERLAVPHALSGADGENRSTAFCYIQASHDLDAVRAYLNRYRDQPKTLRAYTKELERFLLWAVVLRGKALSDLRVEDCEAYKDFLKKPDPRFVGERFARHSPRWRPFASVANGSAVLSPESQRYAIRLLLSAFAWLVDVRYLGGNPWTAVNDPPAVRRMNGMKIDRALPVDLWRRLRDELDVRCDDPLAAQPREFGAIGQWRAVRAAILLMGDSGLRREEAASARRECLRPSAYGTLAQPVWELTIVGKGQRERTVPVSAATFAALRAHWQDRGRMFDGKQINGAPATIPYGPLLAPVVIPWTKASRRRHRHAGTGDPHPLPNKSSPADEAGYTADGLNRLIGRMMKCLVETMDTLSFDERVQLGRVNAHAFRHTFGTQSVADEVPVDVVQKVLGHASLQTTTIYVQAERQRVVEEVARYYAGVDTRKKAQ